MKEGVRADKITVLCANGTHVPLPESVFRQMIDPAVFELGVVDVNHDCLDFDQKLKDQGRREIRVAWMSDGPYGIVI